MRRDNKVQGNFQKHKDESERLSTKKRKVTELRDEAEKNSKQLAHQVYELGNTNCDLTESLEKAKANATSLTEQHHQDVQGLEERIDELQTELKHGVRETKRMRK